MVLPPPGEDGKQSLQLQPTIYYLIFQRAEEHMHCSVAKLLTGRDMPLGNMEHKLWMRYNAAKMRLHQQQNPRRGRR